MKIGLSLSRCIRDIVEEKVAIGDVLVLITRTDFDPTVEKEWDSIWSGYNTINPEWYGLDHDRTYEVVLDLWESGRLHQPRKFGARPRRLPYYWLETVLPDGELDQNPAVKDAWEKFQVISGLASVQLSSSHG
jgi:hypothetical protein